MPLSFAIEGSLLSTGMLDAAILNSDQYQMDPDNMVIEEQEDDNLLDDDNINVQIEDIKE